MNRDLDVLLECLSYQLNDPSAVSQALLTIAKMCTSNDVLKNQLRASNGLKMIQDLLAYTVYTEVKEAAMYCLGCAIERNVFSQNEACTSSLFSYLRSILTDSDSSEKAKLAALFLAICLVANCGAGQFLMRKSGCLEVLLQLFKSSFPSDTNYTKKGKDILCLVDRDTISSYKNLWCTTTRVLCVCVNNPKNVENQQMCAQCFEDAFTFLKSCVDIDILQPLTSFLALSVADNAINRDRLYQCQGLGILLCVLSQAVTEHRADEVIVCYTNVLDAAIMDCKRNAEVSGCLGLIRILFQLLKGRNLQLPMLVQVILTLEHCTDGVECNQSEFMALGGGALLIEILTTSRDEELSNAVKSVLHRCISREASSPLGVTGDGVVGCTSIEPHSSIVPNISALQQNLVQKLEDLERQTSERFQQLKFLLSPTGSRQKADPLEMGRLRLADFENSSAFNNGLDPTDQRSSCSVRPTGKFSSSKFHQQPVEKFQRDLTFQNREVQRNCNGLQLKDFRKKPNNINGERTIDGAIKTRQEEVNEPQDVAIVGDLTINNDFHSALNGKLPQNEKNTAWTINNTLGKEHSEKSVPPAQWRRTMQERPGFNRQNLMLHDRQLTGNDERFEEDCETETNSDEEPASLNLIPENKPNGEKSVVTNGKSETQCRDVCRDAEECSCLIPPPPPPPLSPEPGTELFKKPQCPPQRLLRESLIGRRVFRNHPPPSPAPSVQSNFDLELVTAARNGRRSSIASGRSRRSGEDMVVNGRPRSTLSGKPLGRLLNNTRNPLHGNENACPGCCAPFELRLPLLNSCTFNIALETSHYSCPVHRLIRRMERESAAAVKRQMRAKSGHGLPRLRQGPKPRPLDRDRERKIPKDVYNFSGSSDSFMMSSPEIASPEYPNRLTASLKSGAGLHRRPRIPYSKTEEDNLLKGVAKLGKFWKQILCCYEFHPSRTAVDLMEKYKRMKSADRRSPSNSSTKSYQRKNLPLSMAEERRLRRGVRRHGYNWTTILNSYRFLNGRTAQELRDKWRGLPEQM